MSAEAAVFNRLLVLTGEVEKDREKARLKKRDSQAETERDPEIQKVTLLDM
jgi:hypothetical protein